MPRRPEKLTKSRLDALLEQAEKDPSFSAYIADAGQPGLYARARRGRVRFVFDYLPPEGPPGRPRRRMALDWYGAITLSQARKLAQEHRYKLDKGVDPQVEREELQRAGIKVEEAVERYLDDLHHRAETGAMRGKRGSYAAARRLLHKHVLPRLGSVPLRDVTPDQVRKLHRSMSSTPVEANRTLTALSAVYGYADRFELVPTSYNPVRHVERYAEKGQRRALSPAELTALGRALLEAERDCTLHPSAVLAIRLLALTGFRRSEVLGHTLKDRRTDREGLRWSDVDLDTGLVRLYDTKTGPQTRVIGAAVLELLKQVRPSTAEPADCVVAGTVPGQSFVGIDKARRALWKAAGLEGVDLHSLRHSFASIGAHVASGRYAGHVSALLGHGYQSKAITERYITANPEALRPAADAIAAEIARLLGLGSESRVIAFPGSER